MTPRILVVNIGSGTLKLALFDSHNRTAARTQALERPENRTAGPIEETALRFLEENAVVPGRLDAVSARGGLLRPVPGGTYVIAGELLHDLRHNVFGTHNSNLSAVIAHAIAGAAGIPAFVVDPVTVDELADEARFTGIPAIRRRSVFHALSQKAAGRIAARDLGMDYERANFIIAHLGGGISVGAHCNGKVIDVNNALDGDGPIAPDRAGTVPAGDLVGLCFAPGADEAALRRLLAGNAGIAAHLGSGDMRMIARSVESGDEHAVSVCRAAAYTVARQIGAMAPALHGEIDAVILTGAMAAWTWFVDLVRERVVFLTPPDRFIVYPGNLEMQALADGAIRVLEGTERPMPYPP